MIDIGFRLWHSKDLEIHFRTVSTGHWMIWGARSSVNQLVPKVYPQRNVYKSKCTAFKTFSIYWAARTIPVVKWKCTTVCIGQLRIGLFLTIFWNSATAISTLKNVLWIDLLIEGSVKKPGMIYCGDSKKEYFYDISITH